MKFITKSTKIQSIVASVLTGLALIILIMLSSLLTITNTNKTTMTFIYTISLVLILLLWHGVIQIKVFNDYKCKKNYLCADGILSLCMGALILVSGILMSILQLDKIINGILIGTSDIRIFLTCFSCIIAIWKLTLMIIAIKEKHFNWWCELLFTIFWFALSISCLLTMFIPGITLVWVIVGVSWALIITTIFYILYSYTIKIPTYLETQEAINQLQEEIEKDKKLKDKDNQNISFRLQEKLKKLKDLRDQNLITEEEYTNKKNQLLETF